MKPSLSPPSTTLVSSIIESACLRSPIRFFFSTATKRIDSDCVVARGGHLHWLQIKRSATKQGQTSSCVNHWIDPSCPISKIRARPTRFPSRLTARRPRLVVKLSTLLASLRVATVAPSPDILQRFTLCEVLILAVHSRRRRIEGVEANQQASDRAVVADVPTTPSRRIHHSSVRLLPIFSGEDKKTFPISTSHGQSGRIKQNSGQRGERGRRSV